MRRATTPRDERGVTLVETLVGVGIAFLVLLTVWGLTSLAVRLFGSARKKLTNLQAASLLIERIDQDLRNLYHHPQRPVRLSRQDKHHLTFYVLDMSASRLKAGQTPFLRLEEIAYRFDADSNRVFRREGRGREVALPGTFESVGFFFIPPDFSGKGQIHFNNYFNVRITCATEMELATNRLLAFGDKRRKTTNVLTLIASVGAPMKAMRNCYPVWKPGPVPGVAALP